MASGVKELDGRVGVRDMVRFDPFKIRVEKNFNPRSKETLRANVDRLKPQIVAAGGLLQPLWVRRDGDECVLVDGESRLTAVKELIKAGLLPEEQGGKPFGVPVLHMEGAADEATRITLALTANGGAPLEKWELGKNFARLLNIGSTEKEIAERLGKTVAFVNSCMALNDAPAEVKHMLIMGEVSEGKAVQAVKKYGSAAAERIASAPKNSKGKAVREKVVKFDLKALKEACRLVIAEADTEPNAELQTVHRDTINALRKAL